MDKKLTNFLLGSKSRPVSFVETQQVKEGVECDIYNFTKDSSKDLAIVRVTKGFKTPLQKIKMGTKTIEGYIGGEGTLTVWSHDNVRTIYPFSASTSVISIEVKIGEIMQWYADGNSRLTFYEICEPPYIDGRFENLPDDTKL